MKRFTFITMISLLIPLLGISQTKTTLVDDVYLKPSDVKIQQANPSQDTKPTANYKNGAREIVYIERENPNTKVIHDTVYVVGQANENFTNRINKGVHDTIYVVGQANDSIENNQEHGYYLNGFNGTESDLEYAERIRRFHNPKYEIFVGDPRYNDINFLNSNDWNVYVDGSYAYVTPTWTNPYWWNYNYSPYSYGNWGFGFNNFYSPFCSPWGFDNFYGGYGYGGYGYGGYGYCGYGYSGYGYGGYGGYGYGGYGYGGYGYNNWGRNPKHDEGTRRDVSNSAGTGRVGGMGNSAQSMSGGGGYTSRNPYTVISNSGSRGSQQSVVSNTSGTRGTVPTNISSPRTISINRNGIGLVRTGGLRNLNGLNQNNSANMGSRSATTYTINTSPRTTVTRNSPTSVSTSNSGYVNQGTSRTYSTSNTNSGNYSTGSRSSSPTISTSNSSRSSSSYNSGNSNYSAPSSSSSSGSRSSSSYSGGGSSGGSSSGSSSGGGSRSSGGGGGGSRR